jgi:glycosyltransferase involved in cell wall biosynthesis
MRITYLHQYFNTPGMVGGTRSYEMARRLAAQGHEVHMVTSRRESTQQRGWSESEESGIHLHWLPVAYSNRMDYQERIRAFMRFAWESGRLAASLPTDVIFATSTPLTIALPAVYAAGKRHVPMVFEVRDLWPELPIAVGALRNPLAKCVARRLERFAYRYSDRIVALSDGMADGVVRAGYPRGRVHVIPNGSDLDLFKDSGGREHFRRKIPGLDGKPLITYAGTLGVVNGVSYLVDVAEAALQVDPDLRFAVVGEGREEALVRQRAAASGILDRTFFMLPAVAKSEMPAVLAGSDVAVSLVIDLEPMWANSANKFFDALAAGKPVAINYGGWQAEVLTGSGAGIRLPANDPAAAARVLSNWVADRQALQQAGVAARCLAEERYDRDNLARELEAVLLSAVRR